MRILPALLATTLLVSSAAQAAPQADSKLGDFAFYVGQFSTFRSPQFEAVQGGVEYRWADQFYGLRPTIGVWANSDSAFYGYGGFYWDLPLGLGPIIVSPGVAVGGYHRGDSKALGSALEFRDTLEVTYRFESGQRLGMQVTHMSNADIGDTNPGVEMVQAVFTQPIW